jgi:hypothetical protein
MGIMSWKNCVEQGRLARDKSIKPTGKGNNFKWIICSSHPASARLKKDELNGS